MYIYIYLYLYIYPAPPGVSCCMVFLFENSLFTKASGMIASHGAGRGRPGLSDGPSTLECWHHQGKVLPGHWDRNLEVSMEDFTVSHISPSQKWQVSWGKIGRGWTKIMNITSDQFLKTKDWTLQVYRTTQPWLFSPHALRGAAWKHTTPKSSLMF